jgi:hypothetical protein
LLDYRIMVLCFLSNRMMTSPSSLSYWALTYKINIYLWLHYSRRERDEWSFVPVTVQFCLIPSSFVLSLSLYIPIEYIEKEDEASSSCSCFYYQNNDNKKKIWEKEHERLYNIYNTCKGDPAESYQMIWRILSAQQ